MIQINVHLFAVLVHVFGRHVICFVQHVMRSCMPWLYLRQAELEYVSIFFLSLKSFRCHSIIHLAYSL